MKMVFFFARKLSRASLPDLNPLGLIENKEAICLGFAPHIVLGRAVPANNALL